MEYFFSESCWSIHRKYSVSDMSNEIYVSWKLHKCNTHKNNSIKARSTLLSFFKRKWLLSLHTVYIWSGYSCTSSPSRLKSLTFLVDDCPIFGHRLFLVNREVANSSPFFKMKHIMRMYEKRKFYAWDIWQWKPESSMQLSRTHQQQ